MVMILLSFHKFCQNSWYSPISSNSPVYCEIIVTKLWFMAWFLVFMTRMPYYQKNQVVPNPRFCKNTLEIFSELHPYFLHILSKLLQSLDICMLRLNLKCHPSVPGLIENNIFFEIWIQFTKFYNLEDCLLKNCLCKSWYPNVYWVHQLQSG